MLLDVWLSLRRRTSWRNKRKQGRWIGADRVEILESRLVLYAQSHGHPVHQYLVEQSMNFYAAGFGKSELDGKMALMKQGAEDEDEVDKNPFNDNFAIDHPAFRHFWAHSSTINPATGNFDRDPNDGLDTFDSAMNRSIAYFTGGRRYDGTPYLAK